MKSRGSKTYSTSFVFPCDDHRGGCLLKISTGTTFGSTAGDDIGRLQSGRQVSDVDLMNAGISQITGPVIPHSMPSRIEPISNEWPWECRSLLQSVIQTSGHWFGVHGVAAVPVIKIIDCLDTHQLADDTVSEKLCGFESLW